MKIYSRKYFLYGLASLALGIAVFITAERPVEIKITAIRLDHRLCRWFG